jgi:hypothetical protein
VTALCYAARHAHNAREPAARLRAHRRHVGREAPEGLEGNTGARFLSCGAATVCG